MSRAQPEWIGKTDDTKIPDRVKDRLFELYGFSCEECHRHLRGVERPEYDHRVALINGGENRESNLRVLCAWCHRAKTNSDVAEKAVSYRKRSKNNGTRSGSGRPMPGSRASGLRKRMDGTVERRT